MKRESATTASLNQAHYIDELVDCFEPSKSRSEKTPTDDEFKLLVPDDSGVPFDKPYSGLIGGLLWLAQCTRPDIAFAVNQ